ncbi:MAG: hypothetical protein KGI60_04535 [Patescibacteria group bacterium]|nr:hypothetical protein [Patescibacteria group bacterium]
MIQILRRPLRFLAKLTVVAWPRNQEDDLSPSALRAKALFVAIPFLISCIFIVLGSLFPHLLTVFLSIFCFMCLSALILGSKRVQGVIRYRNRVGQKF